MGIAYRVDATAALIVAVIDGAVSRSDFHDFAHELDEDPQWHAATRSLTDVRSAVSGPVSQATLEAYTEMYTTMRTGDQPLRSAIVAAANFEAASRYGEIRTADGSRTIAFNGVETASIWLGVDPGVAGTTIAELRAELRAP